MKVIIEEDFEMIYQYTYNRVLKFVVIKCNNIDDVNDIIQDTYIELLNVIKRRKLSDKDNLENYVLGIANNIIKRHYAKKKKENVISYYNDNESENDIEIKDSFDLEQDIITKENVEIVWKYLKIKI